MCVALEYACKSVEVLKGELKTVDADMIGKRELGK